MLKSREWVTSSFSNGTGGNNCVAAMFDPLSDRVIVRHSKQLGGLCLVYTREEWDAFLAGVRSGEFDLPA